MQFALPDGYNLNVEDVGSGFPLIVLHGGPGLDHSMFRPYLDPLGDEYHLLYVDERGQGRSQRVDPATLSLEVFARDVDLLAETLELDSFALLGHSFGAIIATYHRSEEHTSELQSPYDLVCRLLLEKKKKIPPIRILSIQHTKRL